ncbi:MAG: WD40 repeat domain-containing protein, partial [Planctomycetota bacterium]|nr:WD40 repeat domain-containing protein [Planctomycetota bacterium]
MTRTHLLLSARAAVCAAVTTAAGALMLSNAAHGQAALKPAGTLDGHTDPVYTVSWSPDGKTIATGGFDNTVRLWNASARKELRRYDGHTGLVLAVAIAPDGKRILSGSLDKTAKIWLYPASSPLKELANLAVAAKSLALKPDGKQAVTGIGKVARVFDPATGATVRDLAGATADVLAVAWSADGNTIAVGDAARAVRLYKAADGAPLGVIETPAEAVNALAFLPNNTQIVSGGNDGNGRIWQLPVDAPRTGDAKGKINAAAATPDG